MRSVRFARLCVRLYPRAWRERYQDELTALLETSPFTVTTLLDLTVGAGREWIRVLTVEPGPAETAARERWRNLRRSSFATLAMAGATWCLAQILLRAGIDADAGFGYVLVPAVIVMLTGLRGALRRQRFQYPGPKDLDSALPDDSPNPGISRREFWIRIVLFAVGLTAWWTVQSASGNSKGPLTPLMPYAWWFLLYQQMSGLRESTKTFLARARMVNILEARRRRGFLSPSPWS